jgi:hypothetical protein
MALASSLAALVGTLGCTAIAEASAGYGELTRFGKAGTGLGELTPNEASETPLTMALGVDPKDNSVYVVDEPEEETEVGKEVTRHVRLQKFKEASGKYSIASSAMFEETSPLVPTGLGSATVEGIAVDSKRKRVYMLVTDFRKKTATIDPSRAAASTLYAFSTEESGKELVPAGKTAGNPILTGPGAGEFETQSNTAGKALLEPRGITVDPYSGDVIVLAKEDAEVSPGKFQQHFVLQRVSEKGTLGARYVDSKDFLKNGFNEQPPDSPLVVGPEGSPRVLVKFEGLAQVPYNFGSAEAPKQLFEQPHLFLEESPIVAGPNEPTGGALSSPDGTTIFGDAKITTPLGPYPGVSERSAAAGDLIGWTGGQNPVEGVEDGCVLQPGTVTSPTPVAAGSEGKVFVLATGFLQLPEEEEEPLPPHPAVVELGPGGTGCPHASSQALTAKASSTSLKQGEKVPNPTEVTFTAHPVQADALSVEWRVENTKTHEKTTEVKQTNINKGEYRLPKFVHTFNHGGPYTVTAVINTDDLGTPVVSETTEKQPISFSLKVAETKQEEEEREKEEKEAKEKKEKEQQEREAKEKKEREEKEKAEKETEEKEKPQKEKEEREKAQHQKEAEEKRHKQEAEEAQHLREAEERQHQKEAEEKQHPPGEEKGKVGVASYQASLASTHLTVSKAGVLKIVVDCSGSSGCNGSVTLRTASAVSARSAAHKRVLTLAAGSFAVAGGHTQTLTLHLSAQARRLLARSHTIKAKATIVARDSSGASHTTQSLLTLKAGKH